MIHKTIIKFLNKGQFQVFGRNYCSRISSIWAVFVLIILPIIGCGGGSSGTGDNSSNQGQIVDEFCVPVPGLDLSNIGLEGDDTKSADDGSFALAPNVGESVNLSDGQTSVKVDVKEPTCIIVAYYEKGIASVNSYPLEELPECSIDGIEGIVPAEELPLCGAQLLPE